MANIEKVIKALECCKPFNRRCDKCPYDADCFHDSFDRVAIADMVKLLKEHQNKKSKEEVLLAIIGKQSYTELEKFKKLEKLNDEYFNGMLDSIRAVEKLFAKDGDGE